MKDWHVKQRLTTIVGFLAVVGIAGLLVMLSGIVPIKASSGHWEITKWLLDIAKSRSVATHSMGIDVPPLDDRALVIKGAGHYETGCVQCHGSPLRPASPIALSMTGQPPALPPKIAIREPQELFHIVKHGIKFTGMPAWPAQQRDDEVWAVVAFLLKLPDMDAESYRELVHVDSDPVVDDAAPTGSNLSSVLLTRCVRCHGVDGLSHESSAFPHLAGQKEEYLLASLTAYASGDRHSGIMQPVAAILNERELTEFAAFYAGLPVKDVASDEASSKEDDETDQTAIERGRQIVEQGIPDRRVPSCADCHGPGHPRRSPVYPRLAGQPADYLMLQLRLFKADDRGGSRSAHLMQPVVSGLTDDDFHDVATFYESLLPE